MCKEGFGLVNVAGRNTCLQVTDAQCKMTKRDAVATGDIPECVQCNTDYYIDGTDKKCKLG
jgi:hypothetical protein